jgi:hypothetical protein
MRIMGIALLFLGALYPLYSYLNAAREKARAYFSALAVLNRINDKILDTGPDIYEIFRDYNGDLRSEMLECAHLCATARRSVVEPIASRLGEDGEAFISYVAAFGKAPGAEEKKKLSYLLERFALMAERTRAYAKDRERTTTVLYISALASMLLLAL